jgi:hypothetical protein
MQTLVLFAAKSDGTGNVDCFRVGQMNAAMRALDHGFGGFVAG